MRLIYMKSNMKFLKKIFVFAAVAAAALGCSGNVDDDTLPVLRASASEIDLAAEETVDFTVTYDGVDVTAESEINLVGTKAQDSWGPTFRPEETGSYTFSASYNGKTSNTVTVNVIDSTPQVVETKFKKHVSLIEFTGAWCIMCPAGYERMMRILGKPSMKQYKDYIHISAFHSDPDDMYIKATDDLFKLLEGSGYPSASVDMGPAGGLDEENASLLQDKLVAAFNENPPHCGVALSSVMNAGGTEAEVTVKVTSELTSEYRVVVLVVEDQVRGPQTEPLYPEGNPDYIHKHAVRQVVTSYAGTFTGEKITSDGVIRAGDEKTGSWTVAIDPVWNLENTEIYALVLDKEGRVNNMNLCGIADGSADYDLK